MSADGRIGGWTDGKATQPLAAIIPPNTPTANPTIRRSALVPIRHPPHSPTLIVGNEQRTVGQGEWRHRPAPARAVGELPSGDEVFGRYGATVLHFHVNHLRAR